MIKVSQFRWLSAIEMQKAHEVQLTSCTSCIMRVLNVLNSSLASRTSDSHSMYGRAGLAVRQYSSLNAATQGHAFTASLQCMARPKIGVSARQYCLRPYSRVLVLVHGGKVSILNECHSVRLEALR